MVSELFLLVQFLAGDFAPYRWPRLSPTQVLTGHQNSSTSNNFNSFNPYSCKPEKIPKNLGDILSSILIFVAVVNGI